MKSTLFYGFFAVLKKRARLFGAWLLLTFFVGGQGIMFAHQHRLNKFEIGKKSRSYQQTVSEKCSLCDAMHFNTMVANEHPPVVHLLVASHYDYIAVTRNFVSFSLILSSGRGPPVS